MPEIQTALSSLAVLFSLAINALRPRKKLKIPPYPSPALMRSRLDYFARSSWARRQIIKAQFERNY